MRDVSSSSGWAPTTSSRLWVESLARARSTVAAPPVDAGSRGEGEGATCAVPPTGAMERNDRRRTKMKNGFANRRVISRLQDWKSDCRGRPAGSLAPAPREAGPGILPGRFVLDVLPSMTVKIIQRTEESARDSASENLPSGSPGSIRLGIAAFT